MIFLLSLLLVSISVQIVFYLLFDSVLFKGSLYLPVVDSSNQPKVSVLVAARNESANLDYLLELLKSQDYPNYEVIIVNDRSTDQTEEIFENWKDEPWLKTITITETPEDWDSKKYALHRAWLLSEGELIVLTDGDCLPSREYWLSSVVGSMRDSDIAIGLSPFLKNKGILGLFTQYENYMTGIQMLGFGRIFRPYMALGRNWAFRRSITNGISPWEKIKSITGGDDDLLVNEWGKTREVSFLTNPQSMVYSYSKSDWKSYFRQKTRHVSVGRSYDFSSLVLPILFVGTTISIWVSSIVLLLLGFEPLLILLGLVTRYLFMIPVVWDSQQLFDSKFKIHSLFILDFLFSMYYIAVSFTGLLSKRVTWT